MSGYSTNPETLRKILPLFEGLAEGDMTAAWEVEPGTTDYWSQKLREGLYIARLYPEEFPLLARVASRVRIVKINEGRIQAQPAKHFSLPTSAGAGGAAPTTFEDAEHTTTFVGQQTPESIVATWTEMQPSNAALLFPQAGLGANEMMRLFEWASPLGLLLFRSGLTITVSRRRRGIEKLAWSPADLSGEELVDDADFPFEG